MNALAIQKTIMINGRRRHTPEYNRFHRIRQRCFNPNDAGYNDYGGRGITICDGWALFENFQADIGPRPSSNYSIDRIDNDGHYSCGKCQQCISNGWPLNLRWATPKQQSNNTRRNVRLTKGNKTLTLTEWALELGVSGGTLNWRHSQGLSDEQILRPVKKRRAYPRRRRSSQTFPQARPED